MATSTGTIFSNTCGRRSAATPTALVRVTELNIGQIKRALDIGADGVVVPWIETADQLRQAVAFAHYPPAGLRGMGGERATCWGKCLPEHAARGRRARAGRPDH